MKRTLPPGVGPKRFDAALKAFASVVGDGWVLATDQDRDTYADIYAPGDEGEWPPSAAIAPASAEETQALVKLANQYKIPLWPISRGKNLGYGTAAPRMPGTVVLDLGRMNKILELDAKLAYCVVEPGVSFFDLYDEVQKQKAPLWLSVPGNAWGSVIGNALDHGIGYTPYGLHARNICGVEVVLPTGEMVRTGMGAMTGNHAWHLFPFGYGPTWDLMFSQSNFGVVTKAGMWLMPAPETSLALSLPIPKEDDIGWVIDTMASLKISGTVDQSLFVPSWLGALVLMGQRKDFYDGKGAMPEEHVQMLLKKYNLGYWTASVRLYGDEKVNKAKADVIRRAFKPHIDPDFSELWWHPGDPIPSQDPTMGVPSSAALQMADWVGGRAAHMGFSPVIPATGEHAMRQLKRSRERIAQHDFDFYASFTIGGRFCNNINMLLFDRDDPDQVTRVRALFNDLVADAKEAGYGEYRTHLGWMDQVAATYDFNAGAMGRLNARVKNALDPNGILAPGKQGVWPHAYEAMKPQGRIG